METEDRRQQDHQQPEYSPPQVEELPSEDDPAVTAAGKSPPSDKAAEWRP